jgi:hypothetical protein
MRLLRDIPVRTLLSGLWARRLRRGGHAVEPAVAHL